MRACLCGSDGRGVLHPCISSSGSPRDGGGGYRRLLPGLGLLLVPRLSRAEPVAL